MVWGEGGRGQCLDHISLVGNVGPFGYSEDKGLIWSRRRRRENPLEVPVELKREMTVAWT